MTKPIVISGMQPSGQLHIGNYLGALKNWVDIQNSNKYVCLFFVADYHSLSENYHPQEKRQQIIDLVGTYLAAGLDPKKSTIFIQSQVPESTELAWIFNTLTPIAELERMTQFKDKSGQQVKNINLGLLGYPVLQAADILLYQGNLVPVGDDQIQHLELTRDIARWFNHKYGVTFFPEAKPLLTPNARIMSLVEPKSKMSKSAGDKHWIGIDEGPESITKKIAKANSTPEGIDNLKTIYQAFSSDMPGEFKADQMAETKKVIADGIANHFANYRKQKAQLKEKEILSILKAGQQTAKAVAEKNINKVKKIIGVA